MTMRVISMLVMLVLFIAALGLALANTAMTELKFFGFDDQPLLRVPLVVLLLAFFIMGVAAGMLARLPHAWRQRRRIRQLERKIAEVREAQIPEMGFPITEQKQSANAGVRRITS